MTKEQLINFFRNDPKYKEVDISEYSLPECSQEDVGFSFTVMEVSTFFVVTNTELHRCYNPTKNSKRNTCQQWWPITSLDVKDNKLIYFQTIAS